MNRLSKLRFTAPAADIGASSESFECWSESFRPSICDHPDIGPGFIELNRMPRSAKFRYRDEP